MDPRALRRSFIAGLLIGLNVVWPILSTLLVLMVVLGLAIGLIEGWTVQESVYFSFVTGLTIGYGDLVPQDAAHANARHGDWRLRHPGDRIGGCRGREGTDGGTRGITSAAG